MLNWNGKMDTIECIQSLQKIDYTNYEIICVDNGSSDGSVECIRDRFPTVRIVANKQNLGWSGGNNVGIRHALTMGAEYILLLNNDAIVDAQIIRAFLDASKQMRGNTILGAKIYYYSEPKKIQYAGAEFVFGEYFFRHKGQGFIDDGKQWNQLEETEYANGAAMFFSKYVVRVVGFFDERFFLNWEEADWCARARRMGIKCYFVPEAMVWHKISASFEGGAKGGAYKYYGRRNRFLWIEKNLSLFAKMHFFLHQGIDVLRKIKILLQTSSNEKSYMDAKIELQCFFDYLLRKFGKGCPTWVSDLRL